MNIYAAIYLAAGLKEQEPAINNMMAKHRPPTVCTSGSPDSCFKGAMAVL
jgi:hypothetical protein